MKKIVKFGLAFSALFVLAGCGFGYAPVKLYEGAARADTEAAALISDRLPTEHRGDLWIAMLVGIDGKMCSEQVMTGDNGPTPKNWCGNICIVLPGEHVLTYAIQTGNRMGSLGNMQTNSWDRLDHFITTKMVVEAGTIYTAKPIFGKDGWTVSLFPACKSKNFHRDAQWLISRGVCP